MDYTLAKQCTECNKTFKAGSNRQKYCLDCKSLKRLERQRLYNQDYYIQNQQYMHEKSTKYNLTEKGKASNKLRMAVRSGKIVRQSCEICGEPNAEGHHTDYTKPLEVTWLCRMHHAQKHLREQWMIDMRNLGYKGGFLLGELIEACGDKLRCLYNVSIRNGIQEWRVDANDAIYEELEDISVYAPTPEVAVAKLYLELHKK